MKIGIYCPTLGRPNKLQEVLDNLKENTFNNFELYWGIEPFDKASVKAAKKTGCNIIINNGKACYSDALQSIYDETDEEIFLWANDDFHFLKDWDKGPIEYLQSNPEIGVLGLHDGNPQTKYSTISMIRRIYIVDESGVMDMTNRVLYPYMHNYVDDELTETAQKRGRWAHYDGKSIEHRHHSFTWLGEVDHDETYQKSEKTFGQDTETFHRRRHLWK